MNRSARSAYVTTLMMTLLVTLVGCARTGIVVDKVERLSNDEVLLVTEAYQPERPGFMTMNAGYLKIQSLSDEDIYIVDVSSPDYKSVSIHRSFQLDGVHKMESIDRLKIPAGEKVFLEPGGMHLMLHEPIDHQKVGDFTTIIFELCDGKKVSIKLAVTDS